ncbi:hypothetical protein EVAR_54641_1 [Eumeta japonica]|uniref:Uncharacterized protein n=1 Tax=Eumeta variegata TaxID=151549 RepID=A0A4C1X5Y2_EUMVA|nr:hypothetical protein EVAR_54641_1 [Eumeta japonica]
MGYKITERKLTVVHLRARYRESSRRAARVHIARTTAVGYLCAYAERTGNGDSIICTPRSMTYAGDMKGGKERGKNGWESECSTKIETRCSGKRNLRIDTYIDRHDTCPCRPPAHRAGHALPDVGRGATRTGEVGRDTLCPE